MKEYVVIYESGPRNWSACVPDLPGCVTTGKTPEETEGNMREAVTLRELDGLSYEEIAQAMDCPIGTVRSRIFRARAAIDPVEGATVDLSRATCIASYVGQAVAFALIGWGVSRLLGDDVSAVSGRPSAAGS